MADRSSIEWTDATWNPVVGCSVVSPGCTNCYAMPMAARIEVMAAGSGRTSNYAGTTQPSKAGPVWTGKLALAPDSILTQPLRWRRPRRIFVNSMGDLFHESVPDEWIDQVFAIMALTPQHTYQVLTKRSARMCRYCNDPTTPRRIYELACEMVVADQLQVVLIAPGVDESQAPKGPRIILDRWPLPNVWKGASTEDQYRADERVPYLLATPAAVRFISAEPLLGALDLAAYLWPVHGWWKGPFKSYAEAKAAGAECGLKRQALVGAWCTFLDLVIVGGESGPGARPMHPDWARSLRDQCVAAGTAFFFKQWGEWAPSEIAPRQGATLAVICQDGMLLTGQAMATGRLDDPAAEIITRFGKRRTGRLLDGIEHNAMPEVRA